MIRDERINTNKTDLEKLIEEKVEEKLEKNEGNKAEDSGVVSNDISRREFLKKSFLGLGGLAVLSSPVSADYFVKDDSFSVQTSNDGGSTLAEGLFVDENQNVEIPNGDLDLKNNSLISVDRINGENVGDLGGGNPKWSIPHDSEPNDISQVHSNLEGSGTQNDPYIITNDHELQSIQNNLSKHYRLGKNIDASGTQNWNLGGGFDPIGTFEGVFDGAGHIIKGLYINRASTDQIGLFQYTFQSQIKNVGLIDADITGNAQVGSLVGVDRGSISFSYSTGSVSGNQDSGGLVGRISSATISSCYSRCSVSGGSIVGGLIGDSAGDVSNSFSAGSVSGSSAIGGLLGQHDLLSGNISNSYWDTESSGQSSSPAGTGLTTSQMQGSSAISNMGSFDFEGIWFANSSYPVLRWQTINNV